ncbi:MAG: hypothetical protein ACI9R3_003117, partial [Verrucomicrobiales bacterium]
MNRLMIHRFLAIGMAGLILGAVTGFMVQLKRSKKDLESDVPARSFAANDKATSDSTSQFVEQLTRSQPSTSLAMEGKLLEMLAQWSPRQLKKLAQDLLAKPWPDAHDRRLLRLAFECYAEKQPEGFLRWMIDKPAGKECVVAIETALIHVLNDDLQLAGELTGQLPSRFSMSDPYSGAVTSFLEKAEIDLEIRIPWQLLTTFQVAQPGVLARSNPEQALSKTQDYDSLGAALFSAVEVFDVWAETDPDAAIAAVEKRLHGSMGRIVLSALLLSGMRDSYPEKVTPFLAETAWKDSSLMRNGLNAWIEKDMESALEFAHSSTNPQTRNTAFSQAGQRLAESDPIRALDFLPQIRSLEKRTQLLKKTSAAIAI